MQVSSKTIHLSLYLISRLSYVLKTVIQQKKSRIRKTKHLFTNHASHASNHHAFDLIGFG